MAGPSGRDERQTHNSTWVNFPSLQDSGDKKSKIWVSISEWPGKQRVGSVVYVALGSESPLSQEELTELALGLQLFGLPFLWALRKPPRSGKSDSVELPEGFEERTKGRGAVAFDDKVGLEKRRDDEDGSFRREVVVETLKQVIVEEEGKTYRDKAEEMKAIFGDKERQDK
ncbi:unnamed protein product [Thlaspi arvense]|uniref:Uncharacterized protein n=1 Tax=Thlaspi arvense TaxID=13288 RepID=A0AAU9RG53_THLAR|nr:unnamed protein product [Thlaspi arvense]